MIKLSIAIYEGDVQDIEFSSVSELGEYVENLKNFKDVVWLMVGDYPESEIVITELVGVLLFNIICNIIDLKFNNFHIHIHEYESYESAYAVALDMREEQRLCYDKPKV
jgi:hypothetical protein